MIKSKQTKHFLAVVLISLFVFSCNKDEEIDVNVILNQEENFVTLEEATEIAIIYEYSSSVNISNSIVKNSTLKNRKIKSINKITDKLDEIICYIINYENGGFIILSADKRTFPILAQSESNTFTFKMDYPPVIVNWIDNTIKKIKNIRKLNLSQAPEIKDVWDNLSQITAPPYDDGGDSGDDETGEDYCENTYKYVGTLLSTTWHQEDPFNNGLGNWGCMDDPEGNPLVGCVPVAMGQVMKYFEYPNNYNWDNMPNTTASIETANFLNDVAEAAGTVNWCIRATTEGINISPALLNNFGYSSAIYAEYNSDEDHNYNKVINDLDLDLPVIMLAQDPVEGGHAWVCDGYLKAYFCNSGASYLSLHMNWGFRYGEGNGYYYYNGDWDPTYYSFSDARKMIYRILP